MKNQYFGDVGDYGKYGMLRYFSNQGIDIGVNWYLTEDDGSNNGKFVSYLRQGKDRYIDEELFDFLSEAVSDKKSVNALKDYGMISRAVYYSSYVDIENRSDWHSNALEQLKNAALVFCDPDNGPIGKKSVNSKGAEKYVTPHEIMDYYNRGQNVVYYCQKARRTEFDWLDTKTEMRQYLLDAKIFVLTYHRGTQRSYIFVVHPEDYRHYINIARNFLGTNWGQKKQFTEEFISEVKVKEEEPAKSMRIDLANGEYAILKMCEDGWVEVRQSNLKNSYTRIKAEDFVHDFWRRY